MPVLSSVARWLADKPWLVKISPLITTTDRALGRWSKGRITGFGRPDIPQLLLTTTGRRSGQERVQPLLYAEDGDSYVVIGSNWGKRHHPSWTANLLAHPEAVITIRGQRIPVRARLTRNEERERLWRLLLALWPAYALYSERAGGRHLRIFSLEPVSASAEVTTRRPANGR
jgi:deazaflavin-dependent oxidoreductase (nitroreductase family)